MTKIDTFIKDIREKFINRGFEIGHENFMSDENWISCIDVYSKTLRFNKYNLTDRLIDRAFLYSIVNQLFLNGSPDEIVRYAYTTSFVGLVLYPEPWHNIALEKLMECVDIESPEYNGTYTQLYYKVNYQKEKKEELCQ